MKKNGPGELLKCSGHEAKKKKIMDVIQFIHRSPLLSLSWGLREKPECSIPRKSMWRPKQSHSKCSAEGGGA